MVQDAEGRWWSKHLETGEWHYYDEKTGEWHYYDKGTGEWVQAKPLTKTAPEWTGKRLLVVALIAMVVIVGISYMIAIRATEGGGAVTAAIRSDFPLQGPGQKENEPIINAITLALEERNYMAGDVTIDYKSWDDATAQAGYKWDEDQCAKNAQSATQNQNIVGWIGPGNSGCAKVQIPILNQARFAKIPILPQAWLAKIPILNQAGLAMISPAATYVGFTKPSPEPGSPEKFYPTGNHNFTRVIVADDKQGVAGAVWMRDLGVRSVYILDDQDTYGKGLADQFERNAKYLGGIDIVGHGYIDPKATNYRDQMEKIAQLKPEAIYFGGTTSNNAGQLVKDKINAEMSNKDVIFMGADGIRDQAFLNAAGDAAKDIYVTFPGLPPDQLPEKGQDFIQKYKEKFPGSGYQKYTAYAYEATNVLLDAIDRAYRADGRVTREGVVRELFATKDYDGVLGIWSFDQDGDTTLTKLSGERVENGEFEFNRIIDISAA